MMRLTLRQLRIFESVARHESYSLAAKELFLSQPAVSMQVKQMEEEIGMVLLERVGKHMKITHAGEELLRYSKSIHQQLNELELILDDLKNLRRGKLHLTMASTANYFAPRLLAEFHHKYPGAEMRLDVTNRAGLLHALDNNTTDMAIMGKPPEGYDLTGIPFMDNPLVIIAWPGHPLAREENIPLAQVANEPFIVRESDSGTRIAAERFFAQHDLTLIAGMEMNRSEAIKQAVMAELGLGIVSLATLEMELALQRLVVLDVEEFPIMRQWHIVYRRSKRFAAIPNAFRNFVLENAKDLLTLPDYK
jgi:DNA-binding transcriptional LysR family regulator